MDWRSLTKDAAHDQAVRKKYLDWLLTRRKIMKIDFFVAVAKNKKVLDIGVVEH